MLAARLRCFQRKSSHTTNTPFGIFLGSVKELDNGTAPIFIACTGDGTGVDGLHGSSRRVGKAGAVVVVKSSLVEPCVGASSRATWEVVIAGLAEGTGVEDLPDGSRRLDQAEEVVLVELSAVRFGGGRTSLPAITEVIMAGVAEGGTGVEGLSNCSTRVNQAEVVL